MDAKSSSRKRKRAYFQKKYCGGSAQKQRKRGQLEPGVRGIIVTSSNNDEAKCVRESYNLLNEYADRMLGEQGQGEKQPDEHSNDSSESEDLEMALKKERDALAGSSAEGSTKTNRRFISVDTGVNNLVFLRTTSDNVDPCALVHLILTDTKHTGTCQARFIQRLIPVEITCKAFVEDIESSLLANKDLLKKHFVPSTPDADLPTYAIIYKCRNNNHMVRENVIRAVGELITATNPAVKVDLEKPKKAILVDIVKTVACISIVDDYMELGKLNLHVVAESGKK